MLSVIKSYYRFFIPLIIMLTLWLIGTIGYVLIDNYTWFDAFYMTIITVATVGYGEVQPLSDAGKIFTAFLIITSFGTFAYAVSSITKFVFDGEFNDFYKNRKLNSSIDKLTILLYVAMAVMEGKQHKF